MNNSNRPPVFRRAAAPVVRQPIPAGQTNTAAFGPNGTLRLNKRMAELGLASRREPDDWFGRGWVRVKVGVETLGMKVLPDVHFEIRKRAQGRQANQVTIL